MFRARTAGGVLLLRSLYVILSGWLAGGVYFFAFMLITHPTYDRWLAHLFVALLVFGVVAACVNEVLAVDWAY